MTAHAAYARLVREHQDLAALAAEARAWIVNRALPLWSSAGFDAETGSFEEALGFDRKPLPLPRRAMVQARQIVVFARGALEGDFPAGRNLALRAGHAWIARYLGADGAPGWVFSIDRAGQVVDATRDLYAHAFVLFALAWLRRLDDHPDFARATADTLAFLDEAFADPVAGGYWDSLPRKDALRRQNPHMHLFEALIELYETTRAPAVLDRCRALDELARTRLLSASGAIREYFADDWSVVPAEGAGSVEPGHQFEWAWLYRRFEAISGENRDDVVTGLIDCGLRFGVTLASGRIIDECGEDGLVRKASSRSWPHAEAAKALATEIGRGRSELLPLYGRIIRRLLDTYCPRALAGGWLDQMDAADRPVSTTMPASSLYHLYFGLKSSEFLLERQR
jgi:mannose-6-phosphate isomerase